MATDLDKMLASTSPEQLAGDPIMRAAFIVAARIYFQISWGKTRY